jgi:hypothetical protein
MRGSAAIKQSRSPWGPYYFFEGTRVQLRGNPFAILQVLTIIEYEILFFLTDRVVDFNLWTAWRWGVRVSFHGSSSVE